MAVIPRVGLEAVLGCKFDRKRTGMRHGDCRRAVLTGVRRTLPTGAAR